MLRSYIIIFVLITAVIIWMFPAFNTSDPVANKQVFNTEKKNNLIQVKILEPELEEIEEKIYINGQTIASQIVEIRARTRGEINKILKSEGDIVKKGEIIASIDIEDRKTKLLEAKALLAQRQTEYEVAKGLQNKGFSSKVKLKTAKTNLEKAKAALEKIKFDIEYTNIKAPFTGILENLDVEIGTYLKEGDKIGKIINLDPLDVRVFISENYIDKIKLNMPAKIILTDKREFTGNVNYIAKLANPTTRTFRVDVRIENTNNSIASGLTAKIEFILDKKKSYKIPLSALVLDDKGVVGVKIVKNMNEKNIATVKFLPIKISKENNKNIWFSSEEKDLKIITIGQDFVAENTKVIVK